MGFSQPQYDRPKAIKQNGKTERPTLVSTASQLNPYFPIRNGLRLEAVRITVSRCLVERSETSQLHDKGGDSSLRSE